MTSTNAMQNVMLLPQSEQLFHKSTELPVCRVDEYQDIFTKLNKDMFLS